MFIKKCLRCMQKLGKENCVVFKVLQDELSVPELI